jgi:hypothetical protein
LVSDGSGKIAASATTTTTEIGYLAGVTSAIQTQLNSKLNLTGGTLTGGLIGTTGSFSSSGSGDTFTIGHTSGSGIALNITKNGNGEGLYINKASGSGNAATIIGTLNATTLVKSGGTSSQFLMADGSVNTSVLASGAYLPLAGGTLTGNLNATTATFAGILNSITGQFGSKGGGSYAVLISDNDQSNVRLRFTNTGGPNTWDLVGGLNAQNNNDFSIRDVTNSVNALRIVPVTGAATFNSSVTASGFYAVSGNSARFYRSANDFYWGINNDSNNYLNFGTFAANGTAYGTNPKMILLDNGNVGIGTSSPNKALEVAVGSSSAFRLSRSGAGEADFSLDGTGNLIYDTTIGAGQIFRTNGGSERMRITSGGFTKMTNDATYAGISSSYHEMRTNQNTRIVAFSNKSATLNEDNGILIQFAAASPLNTTSKFIVAEDSTTVRFVVYSNGNVQNWFNSYGALSDSKLKENITDASPKLDDLLKVKIRNYNLIGDETKQIGVIAQELEEIFPSLIDETEDKIKDEETGETINLGTVTKSVKYSVFVPMLIKAIQEQQAQIEELKAMIAAK